VKKFWALFFLFWPLVALYVCWIARDRNWWFPGEAMTAMGERIEGLFYLILGIVTVVFIGLRSLWAMSSGRAQRTVPIVRQRFRTVVTAWN